MCEILIKVRDYVNADPVKDRRGVHKKGDIVNIKPDGWSDGPNWSQSAWKRPGKAQGHKIGCFIDSIR